MYRVNYISLFLLLFFSCSESSMKYFKKGALSYQKKEYGIAIKQLTKAKEKGVKKDDLYFMLGESYRLSNQISKSTPSYNELLNNEKYFDRSLFWYAASLKANGNYVKSQSSYEAYIKIGTDRERVLEAKREYKKLVGLRRLERIPRFWLIDTLKNVNTKGPEYGLAYNHKKIYWTKEGRSEFVYQGQGTAFTDIYMIEEGSFDKDEPDPLNSKINLNEVHDACPTISPDGESLIFARSNTGKKKDPITQVDLYLSDKIFDQWTEPIRLELNKRGSWTSTPFYAPDNKTLYFSSDRPGGRGGKDIWKGEWDELNEQFINIVNLGPQINTSGDEMFPYVSAKGDFYFSSSGHVGYGRLDLFKVKNFGTKGQRAINLGRPLNSSSDDFGVLFLTDSSGYFCSDRQGGKGFDDIYAFKDTLPNAKIAFYFLKGKVKGRVLSDSNIVTDQLAELSFAKVDLLDEQNIEEGSTETNKSAEFLFEIESEKKYSLLVTYPGYLKRRVSYSSVGKTVPQQALSKEEQDVVFTKDVILDPLIEDVVIDFDPIFFEYNQWDITKESEYILNEMVNVMRDNPQISVEIGSHTDPRGEVDFNQVLSAKRAKSVVDYIIQKGIAEKRITSKGYGENQPLKLRKEIAGFKKGTILTHEYILSLDEELQEEAYRLDRRTEFKITEVFR